MHPPSRDALRPSFAKTSRPLQTEGAGNAGCALHPRSRVRWGRRWCTRAYRAAESIRHSLRNGFTAYNALSPVSLALLPPSTPTSGRQDHTSLPYASMPFVSGTSASTAPRPTFVTIMIRPSCRDGMATGIHPILISVKAKYFLFCPLTRFPQIRSDLPLERKAAGGEPIPRLLTWINTAYCPSAAVWCRP